ncbi:MAG: DegT/DnrJ/EryC1/StrS family aminotransferase [Candidatus Omnitrophica bacterium]|nr:DegT/DnrJ/EryC1/StrS family aminotransferase [Candidatus Omnitrophota bacterium]
MISIAKPCLGNEEIRAARKVILSGWVSQGPRVKEFENRFLSYTGSKYACAVSSCTAGLHLALLAVGVRPGDRVVTVSHSFIATANSIRHTGAEPVFVDIDPETFNISPACLEMCLNKNRSRVAAILVVHQMGMPCDLGNILRLARRFKLPVIEDAACAIGSEVSVNGGKTWERIGKPHGDIACFSFHPRKVITTGDGGMLTANNNNYDKKFRLLRHQGMSISDRDRHCSKKVIFEKYPATGYNYRMTDIQAAIGIEQLKKIKRIVKKRRQIARLYGSELKGVKWLKLPVEPFYCRSNWQSYPVRILKKNAPLERNRLMQRLLDAGISTRRGIMNAHQEKAYALSGTDVRLKNSELARDEVMLLPIFYDMRESQVKKVAKEIRNA